MKFLPCSFLLIVALCISLNARAVCLELKGPIEVQRHPSVAMEFRSAPWVVVGRAIASRNVASPDDPGFYDWTVYDVEVTKVFKGTPPRRIKLRSENSSGRFPLDVGASYLLFVSHAPFTVMAGREKLPRDYVDNCGNSGAADEVPVTLKEVRALSGT
jgi:hypothetical protein